MTLIVIPSTLEQPENSEVGKVFTCHCFYCAPYLSCECFKVQALELNVFSPNLCCSLPMSCLTLCHWMDRSTPGFLDFSVSRSLLKLMCTESVMPSNHLILFLPTFPPDLNLSQQKGLFQRVGSSHQVAKDSASASVLPKNIQGWFPLGLINDSIFIYYKC